MKYRPSKQFIVSLAILLGGGGFLGAEYFLVKSYPDYQQRKVARLSQLLPYENEDLGIEMRISEGIFGEVEKFAGGVRVRRRRFWSVGPSLSITSRPNPDGINEFASTLLAQLQTRGIREEIPRYRFWHTQINDRDAVLIRLYEGRSIHLTGRIISPERIVELDCTPGQEDEELFLKLCEDTIRSVKIPGRDVVPEDGDPIVELQPRNTAAN